MRILGIGYFVAHDANAALVSEEGVEYACSEERLSRKKHDGSFPNLVLDRARAYATRTDVTVAAYNDASRFEHAHEGIADSKRRGRFSGLQHRHEKELRDVGVTEFLGHHFSHAAGAYYTGGISDALVITYDGGIVCEPWLATVWEGRAGVLRPVRQLTRLDGATAAIRYSAVTSLLGFRPVHDEGKVTGLAAKGQPNGDCIRDLTKAFARQPDPAAYYNGQFSQEYSVLRERYSAPDIAASIQYMTETAVIDLLKECVSDPSNTNCVMAGGLFANVLLNLRVKEMGFKKIYVYPAMGDEGLSVGAALAWAAMSGLTPKEMTHVYLGPEFTEGEIVRSLQRSGLVYHRNADIESTMALLLAEGKVVARFNGRMEFGPRALGNRSILYQANDTSVNSWLNKKLGRTETMPFAPVTLSEVATEMYSALDGLERCTPFMTTVVRCSDSMRRLSPAVVHVDGTARPQLITAEVNPSFHKVVSDYFSLTGVPTLINTSFNLHGEPIVCSPDEAIKCFLNGGLDYLAIGNFIVPHPAMAPAHEFL